MQGYVSTISKLQLVLYLSTNTQNDSYSYEDIVHFNSKGAYIEVSS